MIYICNSLSLAMLPQWRHTDNLGASLHCSPVINPLEELERQICRGHQSLSAVGHPDTAALFSRILDTEIPVARMKVELGEQDVALVGQYMGPRLPEGATELPKGATIQWWLVAVNDLGHFTGDW